MAKSFEDEFRDALHESYQRVGSTDEAQEEERLHDARKIAHAILVLLDQAGFGWRDGCTWWTSAAESTTGEQR